MARFKSCKCSLDTGQRALEIALEVAQKSRGLLELRTSQVTVSRADPGAHLLQDLGEPIDVVVVSDLGRQNPHHPELFLVITQRA